MLLRSRQTQARIQCARGGISSPDAFVLALAKTGGRILASGDHALKTLAAEEAVEGQDLLLILDELLEAKALGSKALLPALERIASHPRSCLPKDLIAIYTTKLGAL
jgi:hypothetical protein